MHRVSIVARIALGGLLLGFFADYRFHFLPEQQVSPDGLKFLEALLGTGYMFPLIKTVEVVAAMLLVSGVAVPLALAILSPVILNIALYHLLLDPNGISIAAALGVLELSLLWHHRAAFRPLFTTPARSAATVAREYMPAQR